MTIEFRDRAALVYRTPREQRAVGHAGRRDEHVVARHQVVGREHPVDVVAGVDELPAARRRCAATASPASRRPGT